ncbi:hypothetical protein [Arenibaculum sp.]|jgi:hypothetical protein|uniref:hypothetical protein n=1 Tax=Arenibaculum sp. TaxID=2865862 RepID=UPI002E0D5228|nr:hypothetical protein [Arenibaculum sp.]
MTSRHCFAVLAAILVPGCALEEFTPREATSVPTVLGGTEVCDSATFIALENDAEQVERADLRRRIAAVLAEGRAAMEQGRAQECVAHLRDAERLIEGAAVL